MTAMIDVLKVACPECRTGAAPGGWHKQDDEQDWGPIGVGERWHCEQCDAYLVLTELAAMQHIGDVMPRAGDAVNRWLEMWRDSEEADPAVVQLLIDDWLEMAENNVSLLMNESTSG